MQLSECNPCIGDGGRLGFAYPGARRSHGEITRWSAGFEPCTVRNGFNVVSYFWSLDLFSAGERKALPQAVGEFVDEVPDDIRERVGVFRFAQCFMLRQAAASAAAADLLRSNPNLYWLIACAVYHGRVDPEQVGRLCRRKQVEILRLLVPSATKATLRLLAKTRLELGSLTEGRVVTNALSRRQIAIATAHQQHVPFRLLEILDNHPALAEPGLVALVERALRSPGDESAKLGARLADLVGDIGRMARWLEIERPGQALARCRTEADLTALHDRWLERQQRRAMPLRLDCRRVRNDAAEDITRLVFPEPPFPDGDAIEAIRSAEELMDEGRLQHHCVASYAHDVAAGAACIYRVLSPERATLELRRTESGWRIGQFKLARNAEPGRKTRRRVEDWLAAASIDLSSGFPFS